MSYCYCSPNRSLRRDVAPGDPVPRAEGHYMWRPESLVMGTKGTWVARTRRTASIRGWQTRRRNLAAKAQWDKERAEAAAATEAAERAKAEADARVEAERAAWTEPVVFVPFVIDTPTPAPEETTLSPEFLNTLLEVGD